MFVLHRPPACVPHSQRINSGLSEGGDGSHSPLIPDVRSSAAAKEGDRPTDDGARIQAAEAREPVAGTAESWKNHLPFRVTVSQGSGGGGGGEGGGGTVSSSLTAVGLLVTDTGSFVWWQHRVIKMGHKVE